MKDKKQDSVTVQANFRLSKKDAEFLDLLAFDNARSRNLQVKSAVLGMIKKARKLPKN